MEDCGPTEAAFFLGDSQDDPESLSLAEQTQQRSCQIQTPVEVHSPMGNGLEENCQVEHVFEESVMTLDTEEETVPHPDTEEKADQLESSGEANIEKVNSEPEKRVNSVAILDFKDSDAGSQEDVLEDVCSEKQVLENQNEVNGLEEVCGGHLADISCPEEFKNSDDQKEPDNEKSDESESREGTPLKSETHEETHNDAIQQMDQKQVEQEVDLVGTKDESDKDSHSLASSNGSIVKVSDEESICDDTEDSIQAANGFMKTEEVTHNILDLHMNGCPVEKEDISTMEDEDLQYMTDISKSLDLNSTVTGGDLTENSDFSILETPGLADSKCTEQETLSSLSLDTSEETHEVEVH